MAYLRETPARSLKRRHVDQPFRLMFRCILAQQAFQMFDRLRMKKHLALHAHQGSVVDQQLQNFSAMRSLCCWNSGRQRAPDQGRRFECGFLVSMQRFARAAARRPATAPARVRWRAPRLSRTQCAVLFQPRNNRPKYFRRRMSEMTFAQGLARQAARQRLALVMKFHFFDAVRESRSKFSVAIKPLQPRLTARFRRPALGNLRHNFIAPTGSRGDVRRSQSLIAGACDKDSKLVRAARIHATTRKRRESWPVLCRDVWLRADPEPARRQSFPQANKSER